MCGIFGNIFFNVESLQQSNKALRTMVHRGPDQIGEWFDDRVYMGHCRLSILDLSENGKQPMVNDNKVILTANGEVYNFKGLRDNLKSKHHFVSESDSEILLHGYNEWGIEKLLEKIDGMYAFAIYDKVKHKIFLARDRVGIKPLYYAIINGIIAWASELKALITFFGEHVLSTDSTALYDFLTYRYIPTPKTLYKNIFKLEPGNYLEIDADKKNISKKKYWQLKINDNLSTIDNISHKMRELIGLSVKEQLVSDVPVGFFLSGGMDSSVIVAEASNYTRDLHTYSIGFDVEGHNETQYAQIVARIFNTLHNEKILNQSAAFDLYQKIRKWYDEPFADMSALPTFLVSDFARKTSKVILTGDGGDELFGGYTWYHRFKTICNNRIRISLKFKTSLLKLRVKYKTKFVGKVINRFQYYFLDDLELYTKLMGGLIKEEKKRYAELFEISDEYDDYWYFRKYYRKDLPILTRLQYLDFHTFLHDDVLTKVDRTSMAVSLEVRVPFLSKEIIEFIFSVPEEMRYRGGILKGLLKYGYANKLPKEIISRSKKGFGVPSGSWDSLFKVGEMSRQEQVLYDFFI